MVYVIDASVASRFLLVEDLFDRAGLVLEDFVREEVDLRVSELLVFEVGNTLWRAVKRGFIGPEEAEEKFSYFLGLGIDCIELDEEDHRKVLGWSAENDATYYDSAYVRSSEKVGATLLTADDTLYKKAKGETPTLHLKDYRR